MHWSHSVSRWFMVDLFCCCLSSPVPCSYTVINKGRRPVEFSSWSICFALFWMLSDMSAWFNFLCPKKMIKKRNCPFLLSQPVAMIRHSSFCLRGKSAKAWRALQWGVSKLKQAAPTFAKCVESKSRTLLMMPRSHGIWKQLLRQMAEADQDHEADGFASPSRTYFCWKQPWRQPLLRLPCCITLYIKLEDSPDRFC